MQRDDYRATIAVGLGYLAATLTGFLRQVMIARLLGASRVADIYLVAFAIPEFVFIALPIILSPAFLPIFSRLRQEQGDALAWRFARRVFYILGLSLIILTIFASLAAPIFLKWISPGFTSTEQQRVIGLFYPMLPGILFMGIATLIATILQVYRRFFRSVIITAIYNLVFILSLFVLPVPQAELRAAWAVTLGAAAALLSLLPFWWKQSRARITSSPMLPGNELKEWSSFSFQLILGYGIHHVILFVDRAMATTLGAGSAAAISYADHLTLVIGQLTGLAVSTVMFPILAETMVGGDLETARHKLSGALLLVFKLALPACAGLFLLRTPIIQVLYEHGAFDQQATHLVSAPILWYSIAVLADSICQPLWRVVYIRRSGWTVVGINGMQTALRLAGNLILAPRLGYVGLAVSASLGLIVQALLLLWWTSKNFGIQFDSHSLRTGAQVILATVIAASAAGLIYNFAKTIHPVLIILVCSISGAIIYTLILNIPISFRRFFYGS